MTGVTKKAGDLRLKQRTGLLVSLILGLALLLCVRASAMDRETGSSAEEQMEKFLDRHAMTIDGAGPFIGKTRFSTIRDIVISISNMKVTYIPENWEVLENVKSVKFTRKVIPKIKKSVRLVPTGCMETIPEISEDIDLASEEEENSLNRMLSLVKQMPELCRLTLSEIKLREVSGEVFMAFERVSGITLYKVKCSKIVIPEDYSPDSTKTMVWFKCSCGDDDGFDQLRLKIPNVIIISGEEENHASLSGCTWGFGTTA
jgi:hypothetical protein